MVLKQLQHFLSYLQQFERVFIRQQIDATLAERRYELSAKQKQIEKDEKRIKELDRLFRKIYTPADTYVFLSLSGLTHRLIHHFPSLQIIRIRIYLIYN